ncbi:MAG: hypothetical protein EBZ77_03050, partial [Chitinophagia bacterium]|nr:hypothetical protein [Chitinophagia bacterium]
MLLAPFTSLFAQGKSKGNKTNPADSAAAARKRVLDSMSAARLYRNSKRFKDSVTKARKHRTDSMQRARQTRVDSLHEARQKITDSLTEVREKRTDSVAEIQQERENKAKATAKYKASKRFADSVSIVKRQRDDSLKRAQQLNRDRLAGDRKHQLDSARAAIKHVNDSAKSVRMKTADSLRLVRKRRTDSLTKARTAKVNSLKAKDKMSDEKKKLALEMKMQARREKFTNQAMLKKKWSPMRRFFQNSFTHYNYYYNANRKMEEAKANMLRGIQKENYDSLIRLYPFDPNLDSSLLASDMDSIIRRISVAIQIHDPRVKWGNDLYLIMGEAYYYKGNYPNAAATFKYIINSDEEAKAKAGGTPKGQATSLVDKKKGGLSFLQHKSVHNDAILWLAQTFVTAGQVENGQAVLSLLASDKDLPDDMAGKVAAGKAFAFLADKNYTSAADELVIVMEDDNLPNWLRMRAAFLHGQLMQQAEKYDTAIASYTRCLDFFPRIDMDFAARRLIAYNTLYAGHDVAVGMKPLKKILSDAKYATYYDQIYFVMGKIAAKANRPNDAINYLKQSATTPKATKQQKALSYAELGEVYYSQGMYSAAKSAYDSAAKFGGNGTRDAVVAATIRKGKGLTEITQPSDLIAEQDSLLELADKSKKQQQSVVRDYIRQLEKARKDSIDKLADAGGGDTAPTDAAVDVNDGGANANWYFSNIANVQAGAAEFKRRWGNRQLADNWRRAAAVSAVLPGSDNNTPINETEEANVPVDKGADGLPTEESLLARIPNTPEQKTIAYKKLQKAYMALAQAYLKQLDDYHRSGKTLDTLDKRFPNHPYREEELYLRYQLAIRQNNLADAQGFARELLEKYPMGKYAPLLKPKDEKQPGNQPVTVYYEETYNMLQQHKYQEVLARIDTSKTRYSDSLFRKRFQVTEAMAYAG